MHHCITSQSVKVAISSSKRKSKLVSNPIGLKDLKELILFVLSEALSSSNYLCFDVTISMPGVANLAMSYFQLLKEWPSWFFFY